MDEIHRVLKPGGRLGMSNHQGTDTDELIPRMIKIVEETALGKGGLTKGLPVNITD